MRSSFDETFNIQICPGIVRDISGEPPLPVLTLIHNGPAGTALESLAVMMIPFSFKQVVSCFFVSVGPGPQISSTAE